MKTPVGSIIKKKIYILIPGRQTQSRAHAANTAIGGGHVRVGTWQTNKEDI